MRLVVNYALKLSRLTVGIFGCLLSLLISSCSVIGSPFETNQSPEISPPAEFPEEATHLRTSLEATRLNFVGIRAAAKTNTQILTSKFLGKPYWPKSMSYPRDRYDNEMLLLAQINFGEVPILEDFPRHGILQFFISKTESSKHIWGMSMEGHETKPFDSDIYFDTLQRPDFFRVIYHKPPYQSDNLRKQFPSKGRSVIPILRETSLSFSTLSEIVIPIDYRFEKILGKPSWKYFEEISPEGQEQLNRYYSSVIPTVDAKLGGYAHLVQDDPREIKADEDWIVLLWIGSFYHKDGAEALWGDAGTAMFSIRKSDLKKLDFSRVLYIWDNH